MSDDIFGIPPKMLQQYAERARNGEADDYYGTGPTKMCDFWVGNIEVCIIGYDKSSPVGHQRKLTTAEMQRKRAAKAAVSP